MSILKRARRVLARGRSAPRRRHSSRADLFCEPLEHRRLLSTDATGTSLSQITAQTNVDVIRAVSTGPTGLTPQQIRDAYGINLISFTGGTVSGTGAGETIAIVDAYNDPDIASDLATFDQEYGLSAPPSFTVDNLGATTTDAGWALETSLDVEWAHAIAPQANIILVEAASSSMSSLFSAVSFAGTQAGVTVVSMSWGRSEFQGESNDDSVFTTSAAHVGVTYVAASGDTGAYSGPDYPSVSPNVLAVGGTTLTVTATGSYSSESGWSDSTGGFSGTDSDFRSYESEPSYQTSTLASVGLSDGVRTTPDVSFDADPNSGVSVYDSVGYDGQSGWFQVGGTSLAAPAWAGLIAIVDQGLATGGKGSLTTTQVLTDLYSLPSSDFNDITTGSNGYSATVGYDLVTGLGTPKSNLLVAGVLAANGVSESATTAASSSSTATSITSKSPHKTKSKHAKVVVKKHRNVARKSELVFSLSDDAAGDSESLSRSRLSDSSTREAVSPGTPSSSLASTELTTLSSQSPGASIRAADLQQGQFSDLGAEPDGEVNQSLATDQIQLTGAVLVNESEPDVLSDSGRDAQPVLTHKEIHPMTRDFVVTYEPALTVPSAAPLEPLWDRATEEFDQALAQVAGSRVARRARLVGRRAGEEQRPLGDTRSPSVVSAFAATGTIAAAAYRLVLGPPDDSKLQSSWYSRFPAR